ncbi:carbohydrate porin [Pseudomonas sp. 3A(2025)]
MKSINTAVRSRLYWACKLSVLGSLALAGSAQAAGAFSADSPWMTGDWGGARTELLDKGYDLSLEYVSEAASNIDGGYNNDTTARWSDQFAFGLKVDLQKAFGWQGAEFKLAITERSGRNISNDRIGDPRVGTLSSSQEVWGRGQTWRLTQMWVKQKLFDDALVLKVGRFGPGEEFASAPCDFQNLTFCGAQPANYVNTWYNWPVSQWGLAVKYNITPEFFAQVGVFEQNPSNLEIGNGFKLSGSGSQGTIVPVEVVWTPRVNSLPGEYRLGYYHSSPDANDVYEGADGQPQPVSGGAYKTHSSKHGGWIMATQQVTAHNGDASRGLTVFAAATVHDKATNYIDNFQQIGVVYKGPFNSRPKDDIGIGISRIHVNDDAQDRARLVNALNNVNDYDNPLFLPVQDTEYNSEIYYGFHVTNWLTVRPNLQYIRHPGGVDKVDDALVAGLKIQTKF